MPGDPVSSSATAENDSTKPSAIMAGRGVPLCPIEAPSRIGSIGKVQGAAMVSDAGEQSKNEIEHRTASAGGVRGSADRCRALV